MTICPPTEGDGRLGGDPEPAPARDASNLTAIVDRICTDHPRVPEAEVTELLRRALASTATSPVQNYRLILAEREVRSKLRSGERHPR